MKRFHLPLCILMCALGTHVGHAQGASASLPPLYVEEFQPVARTANGFGPLHAMASGLHAHRTDENAAALSRALVASLTSAHIAAQALPPNAPPPRSGWLVRGVFYSLDEGGHLITIPFLGTRKAPNVEVTVTLADGAKDPDTPFAVIGADSVLKGQGAPLGWNPYVVSARFVVHRIQGDKSLDDLADQITKKIMESAADLASRDAGPPSEH
jgi:hypothetical protein